MKALIASSESEIMMSLCEALAETNVQLELCSTLSEVRSALDRTRAEIIFCQTSLSDGTFRHLLHSLESAGLDPAVIICSNRYDKKTYLDAMTLGAFDYVALPFDKAGLDWIVANAARRLPNPPSRSRSHACVAELTHVAT